MLAYKPAGRIMNYYNAAQQQHNEAEGKPPYKITQTKRGATDDLECSNQPNDRGAKRKALVSEIAAKLRDGAIADAHYGVR